MLGGVSFYVCTLERVFLVNVHPSEQLAVVGRLSQSHIVLQDLASCALPYQGCTQHFMSLLCSFVSKSYRPRLIRCPLRNPPAQQLHNKSARTLQSAH